MRRSTKKSEPKVETPSVEFVMTRAKFAPGGPEQVAHYEAYFAGDRSERIGRATTRCDEFIDGWVGRHGERTMGASDDDTLKKWMDEVEAWAAANAFALATIEDLLATPRPPRYFTLGGKVYHQTTCSGYSGDAFFKGDTPYFEWSAPYVEGVPWKKEDTVSVVLIADGWSLKPVHVGFGTGSQVRDEYTAAQAAGESE